MSTLAADLSVIPLEPTPPPADMARVDHTRLRRRLLYGLAAQDFSAKVLRRLKSIERAEAWGEADELGNLYPAGCKLLAQLYTPEPPRVEGPRGTEAVVEAVEAGGLWALMIRGQRDTIGMREWLVRVDAHEDPEALLGWTLSFRPVYADRVVARPRRDTPDLPGYLAEAVLLTRDDDHTPRWYWEVWSIEDATPYHELRTDLGPTGRVLHRDEGEAYKVRDEYGKPVIPYSLYHAERTGYLWDPYEWREAVEGCLNLVAGLTFYGHVLFKAAWAQRYAVGVDWGGSTTETDDDGNGEVRPRQHIPADPGMLLNGQPSDVAEGGGQPIIGQFGVPIDPKIIIESLMVYKALVQTVMGIQGIDVMRTSGDARSGVALEVDASKQDELRERFKPTFLRGDVETLRVSAAVLGSAAGVALPTRGYEVEYGPEVLEAEDAPVDPATGAPVAAVQDTALNGAQVTALIQIVTDVAAEQIPRDAAIAIVQRAFQVDAAEAEALLGSAGKGFKIAAPAAPAGGQIGGRDDGGVERSPRDGGGGEGSGEAGARGGEGGAEGPRG